MVFVSSCAWDAFAGKHVTHFSNSVTILAAGGWDYEDQVADVRPARALHLEWGSEFV